MRKKIVFGLVFLALILGAVLIFMPSPPPEESIRIVLPPKIIASLPHWVAMDLGFYDDERLKVREVVPLHSSSNMMNVLLSGDVDFLPAVSLLDAFDFQVHLDAPKAVVFSHSRFPMNPPFEALVVLKTNPISTLADLEGDTIGVYPGVTSQAFVSHYLSTNGVDTSRIKFVQLSPPEHFNALLRGDIVCSHSYEPFLSDMIMDGKARTLTNSVYAFFNDPSAMGCSAISYELLVQKPEIADRLFDVWDRAIDFIESEPDSARAILAKHLNIPPKVAKAATWVGATRSTETSIDQIRSTVSTMVAMGLIDSLATSMTDNLVFSRATH